MQGNDKRVRATKIMPRIDFNRGDTMSKVTALSCKTNDLAFAHWQQHANEKAYAAKLITKAMYEFARDEIHKKIASFTPDKVVEACYNV